MASREDAEMTLRAYAGISGADAKALVEAVVRAAADEALELIAGSAPVPTNMGDARALRLRYISQARKRSLGQREVEVVFRLGPSQAATTIARMQATYAQDVDELLKARLKAAATAKKSGQAGDLRYEVHFDDAATFEFAYQLLQRNRLDHDVRRKKPSQILDMPRKITDNAGVERNPLDALGITKP
jgi:hypothetical protein